MSEKARPVCETDVLPALTAELAFRAGVHYILSGERSRADLNDVER